LVNDKSDNVSRLVLVGVAAAEPYFGTEFVWYGGTLMHKQVETNTNETTGSYAGIFYLLDSELPVSAGTYPVKVQFYTGTQNGTGAFTVSEFKNVQQAPLPFVTTVSSPSDTNCGNPSTRSIALNFSQAGSFGYVVMAARQGTSPLPVPGTVTETMNLVKNQPTPLAAVAGYAGPINGNSTLSWTMSNCANTAGVGVVLKRVGD